MAVFFLTFTDVYAKSGNTLCRKRGKTRISECFVLGKKVVFNFLQERMNPLLLPCIAPRRDHSAAKSTCRHMIAQRMDGSSQRL